MKKSFLCVIAWLFLLSGVPIAAQTRSVRERTLSDEIPPLLAGIWQGKDRLVLFAKEHNEYAVVLRVFYTWYADRAAEPPAYREYTTRDHNDTTSHPSGEHIEIKYSTLCENESQSAGAYELAVLYPQAKQYVYVPVAVIDGRLYLDFLIKGSAEDGDFNPVATSKKRVVDEASGTEREVLDLEGYWRDCGAASGLLVSPPYFDKERTSYYFYDNAFYHIRYWKTEMAYSYEKAGFTDGDQNFIVDKYLRSAGTVFTCTTGRRTQIRNIEKSSELAGAYLFDSDGVICAFGEAYLEKLPDADDWTSLERIVSETNARRKPAPKPLFPPTFPRVRWPDFDALDLYDPFTWNRRNVDLGK